MRYKGIRQALVGVLVAALASGAVVAASTVDAAPGPAPDSLHQQASAIVDTGIVGVVAESTDNGRRRHATAGVGNTSTGAPVPVDGEFRIGSTTKTFTATMVLQLVGEGRLSLDDTVEHWLPGVVSGNGNDGSRITVRELLQQTSGLYDFVSDLRKTVSTATFHTVQFETQTPAEVVAIAMRHAPNFVPGTDWSYSNTNFVLAGMIISRVTGHSWEQEVRSRIIDRLALHGTFAPGTDPYIPGPHAEGYTNFGSGPAIDATTWNMSWAGAAGEIISTTNDLSRFFTALLGGRLLRPDQLADMETTVSTHPFDGLPAGMRYGLGLMWIPLTCGGGYFGHVGDTPGGYHTRNGVTPDLHRVAVVSATGDGDSFTGHKTDQAMDALVDQQLCGR